LSENERHTIIGEVRELLTRLETLVEGKAAAAFDPKVSSGKSEGGPPSGDRSDYDYFLGRLRDWCKDARQRVRHNLQGQADKHGQLPELDSTQRRYWLLTVYEGVEYRRAAENLGIEAKVVYQMRKDRGLDPRTGRKAA
jgi:hypothetical protein